MRTIGKSAAILLLSLTSAVTGNAMAEDGEAFTPRLQLPRLAPVPKESRTPAQQAMLASRPDYAIYTTLAHDVDLYNRWSPLGQYLLNGSKLPPRHREMVMLRMGWLCQAEYEWSQHARIAKGDPGLTDEDIHRIAAGPDAAGWSEFERTLLRMVDELRYDAMISNKTWQGLRAQYSLEQTLDALYTAAQYQLVSMALNSLGVQLDPILKDRMPTDVPAPRLATAPTGKRLSTPRVKPLAPAEWSAQQRELITPQIKEGRALNLYATILNHPALYGPRATFGSYLQRDSLLPAKTRELLIMRTAWLLKSQYEWSHHFASAQAAGFSDAEIQRIRTGPKAAGWSEEHRAVLQAVDELRREAFMSEETWETLQKHYNAEQLIEIIYTTGGYTMTALAINSLGIQVEDGLPGK